MNNLLNKLIYKLQLLVIFAILKKLCFSNIYLTVYFLFEKFNVIVSYFLQFQNVERANVTNNNLMLHVITIVRNSIQFFKSKHDKDLLLRLLYKLCIL